MITLTTALAAARHTLTTVTGTSRTERLLLRRPHRHHQLPRRTALRP